MSDNENTLLEFPCQFPIKVMGKSSDDFKLHVLSLLKPHCPEITEEDLSTRQSKGKNFIAITANINAQNQAQLDSIYQALTADPRVVMAL